MRVVTAMTTEQEDERLERAKIVLLKEVKRETQIRFGTKFNKIVTGTACVDVLISSGITKYREAAVAIGEELIDAHFLYHVFAEEPFDDKPHWYRFRDDEDHGCIPIDIHGTKVSWASIADPPHTHYPRNSSECSTSDINVEIFDNKTFKKNDEENNERKRQLLRAAEEFDAPLTTEENVVLLDRLIPLKWCPPTPKPCYDLVIIGGGPAGVAAAEAAVAIGAEVAIVEQHFLGGALVAKNSIPSKALLKFAGEILSIRRAQRDHDSVLQDTHSENLCGKLVARKLREALQQSRLECSPRFAAERLASIGVDVFFGTAKFLSPSTISVQHDIPQSNSGIAFATSTLKSIPVPIEMPSDLSEMPAAHKLEFSRCLVATGVSFRAPRISGLKSVKFLHTEMLCSIKKIPKAMLVIGAGRVGVEISQAFARLGTIVTLIEQGKNVLSSFQCATTSAMIKAALESDGVRFHAGSNIVRIQTEKKKSVDNDDEQNSVYRVFFKEGDNKCTCVVDAVFVATPRTVNVKRLGLRRAGVKFNNKKGIQVNDFLQTSASHIYAAGDVCTSIREWSNAEQMGRQASLNALMKRRQLYSDLQVPIMVHSEPQVALVGLSEQQLTSYGKKYDVFELPFDSSQCLLNTGTSTGFVRILIAHSCATIAGAIVVSCEAAALISAISVAIASRTPLSTLSRATFPQPTQLDVLATLTRRADDFRKRHRSKPMMRIATSGLARSLMYRRRRNIAAKANDSGEGQNDIEVRIQSFEDGETKTKKNAKEGENKREEVLRKLSEFEANHSEYDFNGSDKKESDGVKQCVEIKTIAQGSSVPVFTGPDSEDTLENPSCSIKLLSSSANDDVKKAVEKIEDSDDIVLCKTE